MTTQTLVEKLTALDLLVDDRSRPRGTIEAAITERKLLETFPDDAPPLSEGAAKFLLGAVTDALETLLAGIGLDDLLTGGWQQLDAVAKARTATREDHGTRHVSLFAHEITSAQQPRLDMLLNEVAVPIMHLRLDASFVLDCCDLVVTDGEIVDVKPGIVSAAVELASGGVTMLKHAMKQLDPSRLFGASAR